MQFGSALDGLGSLPLGAALNGYGSLPLGSEIDCLGSLPLGRRSTALTARPSAQGSIASGVPPGSRLTATVACHSSRHSMVQLATWLGAGYGFGGCLFCSMPLGLVLDDYGCVALAPHARVDSLLSTRRGLPYCSRLRRGSLTLYCSRLVRDLCCSLRVRDFGLRAAPRSARESVRRHRAPRLVRGRYGLRRASD